MNRHTYEPPSRLPDQVTSETGEVFDVLTQSGAEATLGGWLALVILAVVVLLLWVLDTYTPYAK